MHHTNSKMRIFLFVLCTLGVALCAAVYILFRASTTQSIPAALASTPSPTPAAALEATFSPEPPSAPETPEPSVSAAAFLFNEIVLPDYIKDFLPEQCIDDYKHVLSALYAGEKAVILHKGITAEEWGLLRRAVQIAFPPRFILYDANYYVGSGPFLFDEQAGLLTINYGFDGDEPFISDKAEYLEAISDFKKNIEDIFNSNVSDITDQLTTSKELYEYVSGTLFYEFDLRLTVYDAFTSHTAYCQTYSEMYQFLMWQAGFECMLYSGNIDHEWNVICLNGNYYHVDTTWQSTTDCLPLYFFGMSDAACELTGHSDCEEYCRTDALLDYCPEKRVICDDVTFDALYRTNMA